jgi:hypothetical protein
MTDEELKRRLSNQEDGWTECKSKGVNTEEIAKTIIAFANSLPDGHKGILFIGISNKGSVEGVDDTDGLQKRVRYAAEEKCYPPIHLGHNCKVIQADGKDVVAVIVEASYNRPHFAGPSYVRVGSETVTATAKQFDELIASRISKARPLLDAMHNGDRVTLFHWSFGRSNRLAGASAYPDCIVTECTPQYAVFKPATTQPISADWDRITLRKNFVTNQLLVAVDG